MVHPHGTGCSSTHNAAAVIKIIWKLLGMLLQAKTCPARRVAGASCSKKPDCSPRRAFRAPNASVSQHRFRECPRTYLDGFPVCSRAISNVLSNHPALTWICPPRRSARNGLAVRSSVLDMDVARMEGGVGGRFRYCLEPVSRGRRRYIDADMYLCVRGRARALVGAGASLG